MEVEDTLYFAIFEDHTFEKHISINPEVACKFWIQKEDSGYRYTTSFNNTYIICNYSFLDETGVQIQPKFRDWRIYKIREPQKKHSFNPGFYVEIIDPTGSIKTKTIDRHEEAGWIEALNLLRSISKYDNWQSFELNEENEKLRNTIATQTERLNELESSIEKLKSTRWFKSLQRDFTKFNKEGKIGELLKNYKINKSMIKHWFQE